jgi:hypothetical protein
MMRISLWMLCMPHDENIPVDAIGIPDDENTIIAECIKVDLWMLRVSLVKEIQTNLSLKRNRPDVEGFHF